MLQLFYYFGIFLLSCYGKLQAEIQDTEAVTQEAAIYCASTDSEDSSPKAEPQEQKGLML
jgi:hypothetical protein